MYWPSLLLREGQKKSRKQICRNGMLNFPMNTTSELLPFDVGLGIFLMWSAGFGNNLPLGWGVVHSLELAHWKSQRVDGYDTELSCLVRTYVHLRWLGWLSGGETGYWFIKHDKTLESFILGGGRLIDTIERVCCPLLDGDPEGKWHNFSRYQRCSVVSVTWFSQRVSKKEIRSRYSWVGCVRDFEGYTRWLDLSSLRW